MQRVFASAPLERSEFHQRLREWAAVNTESQIGGVNVQGRTPWIYVADNGSLYKLHADAKRDAVQQYIGLLDEYGDNLEWTVVPNLRGKVNAVAYGPDRVRIVPFYFYLASSESKSSTAPATRYWMTTHWPPEVDYTGTHLQNVYLQDGHESVARDLAVGDKVLIYESAGGRTVVEHLPDGTQRLIPRREGRQGIVTVAEISTPLRKRSLDDSMEHYADGSAKNWAWLAETNHHASNGFVSLAQLLPVLGYSGNYNMRGFGEMNSGLRPISKVQFDQLVSIFRENPRTPGNMPHGQEASPGHWQEGGGEGPEHLALKTFVAENPEFALSEEGVTTFAVEYPYPSGDRADIVLRDKVGRFIGVEVEIQQDDGQLEGLLQAIKYRHMLAVMQNVTFEECRSVLVAYKLGERIKRLCQQYEVEAVEVRRSDVFEEDE